MIYWLFYLFLFKFCLVRKSWWAYSQRLQCDKCLVWTCANPICLRLDTCCCRSCLAKWGHYSHSDRESKRLQERAGLESRMWARGWHPPRKIVAPILEKFTTKITIAFIWLSISHPLSPPPFPTSILLPWKIFPPFSTFLAMGLQNCLPDNPPKPGVVLILWEVSMESVTGSHRNMWAWASAGNF